MKRPPNRQHGSALILAMLTVALVATISAAAFWQQWRGWTLEQAERHRGQAEWMLSGAMDWARLILREDARSSSFDHLGEPWAQPLPEARVSSFLSASDDQSGDLMLDAFLSGQIIDLQGRLNLRNLLAIPEADKPATISPPELMAVTRLFNALQLPNEELEALQRGLLQVYLPNATPDEKTVPMPERYEQLEWLGLSKPTLQALAPYTTWLPNPTPLNLNTAPAMTIYAAIAGLSQTQAQSLVHTRTMNPFESASEAAAQLGLASSALPENRFASTSRYFLVKGQLRLEDLAIEERSLVFRQGARVVVLWRERGESRYPIDTQQ